MVQVLRHNIPPVSQSEAEGELLSCLWIFYKPPGHRNHIPDHKAAPQCEGLIQLILPTAPYGSASAEPQLGRVILMQEKEKNHGQGERTNTPDLGSHTSGNFLSLRLGAGLMTDSWAGQPAREPTPRGHRAGLGKDAQGCSPPCSVTSSPRPARAPALQATEGPPARYPQHPVSSWQARRWALPLSETGVWPSRRSTLHVFQTSPQ